jgi:hypothetical protein
LEIRKGTFAPWASTHFTKFFTAPRSLSSGSHQPPAHLPFQPTKAAAHQPFNSHPVSLPCGPQPSAILLILSLPSFPTVTRGRRPAAPLPWPTPAMAPLPCCAGAPGWPPRAPERDPRRPLSPNPRAPPPFKAAPAAPSCTAPPPPWRPPCPPRGERRRGGEGGVGGGGTRGRPREGRGRRPAELPRRRRSEAQAAGAMPLPELLIREEKERTRGRRRREGGEEGCTAAPPWRSRGRRAAGLPCRRPAALPRRRTKKAAAA